MGANTYNLTKHIKITLSWKSSAIKKALLDLSAFLLDDDGVLQGLDSVVFYGSQKNEKGQFHCSDNSIFLDSHKLNNGIIRQVMQVDLDKIAPNIRTIVLVISLDTENLISKFSCTEVRIEDEKEILCRVPIDYINDDAVGGIILGNIYRYGESWKYENEESTFTGGLDNPYYSWYPNDLKGKTISFNRTALKRKNESEENTEANRNNKSGEVIKNITYSLSPNKQKTSFGTMPKSKINKKCKSTSKQARINNNQKLSAAKMTETETTSVKTTTKDDTPKAIPKKKGVSRGVMPYKNNHK